MPEIFWARRLLSHVYLRVSIRVSEISRIRGLTIRSNRDRLIYTVRGEERR